MGFEPTKAYATGWLILVDLKSDITGLLSVTLPLWPDSCLARSLRGLGYPRTSQDLPYGDIDLRFYVFEPLLSRR